MKPDLYYYGTDFGSPFIVKGSWPEISRQAFISYFASVGVKPADAGIVPEFEDGNTVETSGGISTPLNREYFASAKTATELMTRFGADRVALIPYLGADGTINTSTAKERWLVWDRSGVTTAINAGKLAVPFANSPEILYPHVAENATWRAIAQSAGQKLPRAEVAA
jgi:hypothetical protein